MDTPVDEPRKQRWFAAEANNLAWDLYEAETLSPEDAERMIDAAHAACFHWRAVGGPVNYLRAQVLLASAYSKAGLGEAALRHAKRALAAGEALGDEQTPWDRATLLGAAGRAYSTAGDTDRAAALRAQAEAATNLIPDAADIALFHKLFLSN